MRKRFSFAFIAAVLILTGLLPGGAAVQPAAAGGSWSAWAYNSTTGQMVHAFPDGAAATTMMFPLPPGTSSYPHEVTISRDGALLAACLTDDAGNPSVRVYDIYNGVYIAAYMPTAPIVACSLGRYAFSPDGSSLAFGILNHYPDPADPRPDWEVIVMQMYTGAILYQINSSSPAITALGRDYTGHLPFVRIYDTNVIAIAPVRWGTEGAAEYDSLIWQLATGAVSIVGPYGKSSLDFYLPDSEVIWVDEDPSLPTGTLEGPGFLFNVVMYSNKMGDLYPIFHNGPSVLEMARFIDGGRRIAVRSYTAPGPAQWLTMDRSGVTGLLPIGAEVNSVWGTPDGDVFLMMDAAGIPSIRYHRFSPGAAMPTEFTAWTGTPARGWRIIWVNPLSGDPGLAPFPSLPMPGAPPAIVTLPPPAVITLPPAAVVTLPPAAVVTLPPPVVVTLPAPITVLTPQIQIPIVGTPQFQSPPIAMTPAPPQQLYPGGPAQVHTTEGDMLRVRSGPGTGFQVVFQLANGTMVRILEGPTEANGYSWWRIQTSDGRSGWVVEGVTDNGTFLQTLIPMR